MIFFHTALSLQCLLHRLIPSICKSSSMPAILPYLCPYYIVQFVSVRAVRLLSLWILCNSLTFILLMWRIGWAPISTSKWQMIFNSAFKGLIFQGRFVSPAPNPQPGGPGYLSQSGLSIRACLARMALPEAKPLASWRLSSPHPAHAFVRVDIVVIIQ